jgi:hypothetical protein
MRICSNMKILEPGIRLCVVCSVLFKRCWSPNFNCGRPTFYLFFLGGGLYVWNLFRILPSSIRCKSYFHCDLDSSISIFRFQMSRSSLNLVFFIWSCYAPQEFLFCSFNCCFLCLCCSPYLWSMCKLAIPSYNFICVSFLSRYSMFFLFCWPFDLSWVLCYDRRSAGQSVLD